MPELGGERPAFANARLPLPASWPARASRCAGNPPCSSVFSWRRNARARVRTSCSERIRNRSKRSRVTLLCRLLGPGLELPLRLVEAHPLESRAVPGLDVGRPGPLGELQRIALVVDPELRLGQRLQIGQRPAAYEGRVGRKAGRAARVRPHGLEVEPLAPHLLVDRPRAVAVLPAQVALEDDQALLDGQPAEHLVVQPDLGVTGGELLAHLLRLPVTGLGEPSGRAPHPAPDERVHLLAGDDPEGEMTARGDLGRDVVGDQPGEPGPDGQLPGRPGPGSEAVRRVVVRTPSTSRCSRTSHTASTMPSGPQAAREVDRRLPGDGLALVPHGGHREAEDLEPHTLAAGAELQLAGEPGAGRNDAEGVGDAPGQPDAAGRLLEPGQDVAQEHLVDGLRVVAEFGDVEDVPGERSSSRCSAHQ